MASQRKDYNDSLYPYSDRMSDYVSPLHPQMRAYQSPYQRPYCDPGRDRSQILHRPSPWSYDSSHERRLEERYHRSVFMGDNGAYSEGRDYIPQQQNIVTPAPPERPAALRNLFPEGRDYIPHQQNIVTPAPPERPAALRNIFPENIETNRPANALPLRVSPTTYARELLVSSKKKSEMTDTEVKAKNFFASSVRQAVDLYEMRCMKDTQTYRKVKEKILWYNPTLDDTRDLKFIKTAVQKHVKYRRRTIRKRNPGMERGLECAEEEEAIELNNGSGVKLMEGGKFVATGKIISIVPKTVDGMECYLVYLSRKHPRSKVARIPGKPDQTWADIGSSTDLYWPVSKTCGISKKINTKVTAKDKVKKTKAIDKDMVKKTKNTDKANVDNRKATEKDEIENPKARKRRCPVTTADESLEAEEPPYSDIPTPDKENLCPVTTADESLEAEEPPYSDIPTPDKEAEEPPYSDIPTPDKEAEEPPYSDIPTPDKENLCPVTTADESLEAEEPTYSDIPTPDKENLSEEQGDAEDRSVMDTVTLEKKNLCPTLTADQSGGAKDGPNSEALQGPILPQLVRTNFETEDQWHHPNCINEFIPKGINLDVDDWVAVNFFQDFFVGKVIKKDDYGVFRIQFLTKCKEDGSCKWPICNDIKEIEDTYILGKARVTILKRSFIVQNLEEIEEKNLIYVKNFCL